MTADVRSMAGPPPPLDSTDLLPPSGEALTRLARWVDQQTDGAQAWQTLPTRSPRPWCACREHSPEVPELCSIPEHLPMFGPPRPVDKWARLRLAQRADLLAQADTVRRAWAAQVPRWTGTTQPTTSARATEVALSLYHPPRDSNRLAWRTRAMTLPCRLTVAQPTAVVVGKYPKPVADLDPTHPLAQAEAHPLILPPGESAWLTADGHVTERVSLDIDGQPIGTGGKGKTSARPSTVPSKAKKSPQPVQVGDKRQRVWVWLDQWHTVQARTLSGHDVRLTPRGRSSLAAWLAPRTSETV